MAQTSETAFNFALAESLRNKHPLWRDSLCAKQTNVFQGHAGLRPDILFLAPDCQPLVVETEHDPANTVENDAIGRLDKVPVGSNDPVEQAIAGGGVGSPSNRHRSMKCSCAAKRSFNSYRRHLVMNSEGVMSRGICSIGGRTDFPAYPDWQYSIDGIYRPKSWVVEHTNEFGDWWTGLAESEQDDIVAVVELLSEHGSELQFPYSSGVAG